MSDSVNKYFENADSTWPIKKQDQIVENVIKKYRDRSEVGISKYGTTLEDSKEDQVAFLTHLQEELLDASLYIEVLLKKICG